MAEEKKRGRGRPKGSKNKPKTEKVEIKKATPKKSSSVAKVKKVENNPAPAPAARSEASPGSMSVRRAKGDAVVVDPGQDTSKDKESYHVVIVDGKPQKISDTDNPDLY